MHVVICMSIIISITNMLMHFRCVGSTSNVDWNLDSIPEPAGSEPIHTGSISKCASFWRTFVKCKWVMKWIDHGYDMF